MEQLENEDGVQLHLSKNSLRSFMLSFMAVIWRRVWITAAIYSEHNKMELEKNTIIKSLKYNIFAETGIGNTLKPYIQKVMTDGYILPNMFNKNIYASRAIMLYEQAYNIVLKHNHHEEMQFVKDYAISVFLIENAHMEGVSTEMKDTIDQVNVFDIYDDTVITTTNTVCNCKLCAYIDNWDIQTSLIYSDDPYENIIMEGLNNLIK